MFTESDYEKLHQIMAESPEKEELLTRLLHSHRMDISTISHEIRNPLTLIYSTLQMIESSNPEVLNIRHWSDLHSDIEYMKQLLEELSAYNNGQRLSPSSTDFDIFLKKISLSFASSIIETDIEFISRIEPELPVMPADSIKLRAVLIQQSTCSNHLDSACHCESNRSLDTGKALTYSPQIHFHAWKEHSNLIISVSDNGCGIAPEHLSSVFEPFVTYKSSGTGLGLPLSRRIIEAHGGTLTVHSEPDLPDCQLKTTFTLTIPIP